MHPQTSKCQFVCGKIKSQCLGYFILLVRRDIPMGSGIQEKIQDAFGDKFGMLGGKCPTKYGWSLPAGV
jgi:hypothetical protein